MQNRKRDTDLQNSHLDSVGEGEGGMFQEDNSFNAQLSAQLCVWKGYSQKIHEARAYQASHPSENIKGLLSEQPKKCPKQITNKMGNQVGKHI